MARCPACKRHFRTLPDEVGMHDCPHCGHDGQPVLCEVCGQPMTETDVGIGGRHLDCMEGIEDDWSPEDDEPPEEHGEEPSPMDESPAVEDADSFYGEDPGEGEGEG